MAPCFATRASTFNPVDRTDGDLVEADARGEGAAIGGEHRNVIGEIPGCRGRPWSRPPALARWIEAPVSTIMAICLPFTSTLALKWPSRRLRMRISVRPPALCSTVIALPGRSSPTTRAAIGGDLLLVGIEGNEGEPEREPGHGITHHRARAAAYSATSSRRKNRRGGRGRRQHSRRSLHRGLQRCRDLLLTRSMAPKARMNRASQVVTRSHSPTWPKLSRRAGNAAMMAARSASLIDAQLAISSIVRPQPMQSPSSELSKQTFTQGVSNWRLILQAM